MNVSIGHNMLSWKYFGESVLHGKKNHEFSVASLNYKLHIEILAKKVTI